MGSMGTGAHPVGNWRPCRPHPGIVPTAGGQRTRRRECQRGPAPRPPSRSFDHDLVARRDRPFRLRIRWNPPDSPYVSLLGGPTRRLFRREWFSTRSAPPPHDAHRCTAFC